MVRPPGPAGITPGFLAGAVAEVSIGCTEFILENQAPPVNPRAAVDGRFLRLAAAQGLQQGRQGLGAMA